MISGQFAISDKLKPIKKRLDTLDEHFRHSGNLKQYRGHKAQYDKLYAQYKTLKKSPGFMAKRKAEKARIAANGYYETFRREITSYETAEKYLKDVLQARFDPKKSPLTTSAGFNTRRRRGFTPAAAKLDSVGGEVLH